MLVILVLAMVATSTPLAAEDESAAVRSYRWEAFGEIAGGWLGSGHSLLASGPDFGVGVGVRPFSGGLYRLGFEFQTAWLAIQRSTGQVSQSGNANLIAASVLCHFRDHATIQPFVFGGLSHVNADYTWRCMDCVFNRDPVSGQFFPATLEEVHNDGKFGYTYGAGLKVVLERRVSLRTDLLLADTTPGSGPNWGWLQVQAGLGVHF